MEEKTTRDMVAKYVTNDLEMIISFVNMIRSNPVILNGMIDVIHARIVANEEAAQKQTELDLEPAPNGK